METATSAEDPLRAMAELLTDFVMEADAGEPYFRFNNLEVECCIFVQIL
jgi:hypothetical protein